MSTFVLKVNAEFFPDSKWRVNLTCNLGYGDTSKLYPCNPRLECEEAETAARAFGSRLIRCYGCERSITNCAVKHHIFRRRRYVSKKCPIYGCHAHYGCPGLPPRPGNLLGDPGGQCERRSYLRSKVPLEALESGLGRNKAGQERSQRACASSPTDHAAGHLPCQCGARGVCDSFVSGRQEVSGQLS